MKRLLLKKQVNISDIKSKVYAIRGVQVMFDFDLAEIYGYKVKTLNQQVKRNINRFPEDFMFRITKDEIDLIKSQFVTLLDRSLFSDKKGGNRKLPYVFTEQGIYMLATVLKGELAEKQSIYIMRAFKEMRHYIHENMQFVTKNEMKTLTDDINNKNEKRFNKIEKDIDKINENFIDDNISQNFNNLHHCFSHIFSIIHTW